VKNIVFLFFALLLVPTVLSLTAVPEATEIIALKGEEKVFYVDITNNNNFTLYNLTLQGSDYINMDYIESISQNQTIEATLRILKNDIGSFAETLRILGFRKVNCSVIGQQTQYIDLTYTTYPTTTVCRNDKIAFHNSFEFPMPLEVRKDNGDLFTSYDIPINSTHTTPAFAENGNYYFKCVYNLCFGNIVVSDKEALVHSSSYDAVFSLSINIIPELTTLSIDLIKDNFTIAHSGYATSYFIVTNEGAEEAVNIYIKGEWMDFESNNFDLSSGESKAVNYIISPIISTTGDTDKTYTKTIFINATNVNLTSKGVSIYIPYADIVSGNITSSEYWKWRKAYCDAHPTAPDCATEPIIIYQNVTGSGKQSVNINITSEEFIKWLNDTMTERMNRNILDSYIKQQQSNVTSNINDINSRFIAMLERLNIMEESQNDTNVIMITIFALSIFIISIGITGFFIYRIYLKKRIEGAQQY